MVSKLLPGRPGNAISARSQPVRRSGVLQRLADCYYDIRAGIGDWKTPEVYGAFPMDPYSHTPAQGGARQPGLTGQVKEDFLCRLGELGVFVENQQIHFRPLLLRREEFLTAPSDFIYYDVAGAKRRLPLKPGELGFTYCQVPVIYRLAQKDSITVLHSNRHEAPHRSVVPGARRSVAKFSSGQAMWSELKSALSSNLRVFPSSLFNPA